MNPSGLNPMGFSRGQHENDGRICPPPQWQYFPARHETRQPEVQAPSRVTYTRPSPSSSSSQYGYASAPRVHQQPNHYQHPQQQQSVYRMQSEGMMMPPPNPIIGGGGGAVPQQPLHHYQQDGYGPSGQGINDRAVVTPCSYGLPGATPVNCNTYHSESVHYPTPRGGGVASRVRRYPSGADVSSSSSSTCGFAPANVRSREPVSAVYGAYRQYDASSGNSYTYTSQSAFKATTGAMRSTAVILLMGSYSEELCLSAKQAILMVPGVIAVTTQQVTWARKQKAYATVSLVRGLNSAMQNALLRTLEEAGIQGLVIAEDTLKELIMSSANDGSSSSRNQDKQKLEEEHHEAIIEAAKTIPEGTVSAAVASRQAAMREYSERGVSTDSIGSGIRRRSLAESHALLGQESPEGGVERAKEALQIELPHLESESSAPTVTSIENDSENSRGNDKENEGGDNPRSIPELDAAKVEPSLTLPPYDRQWVPLSDLPLRDRTGSSMRRRKDSGDASPMSPEYIETEEGAKDAVGRWLSESPDRCSDGSNSVMHRDSFDDSLSGGDDDNAYLDEYGDPTKQNSNAQMQFFNQAAMSFGYTRALGMHEKFAGVVTLHTGEDHPSEEAAKEATEGSSKGKEPDSKHYYGGSWFGGWLGNN